MTTWKKFSGESQRKEPFLISKPPALTKAENAVPLIGKGLYKSTKIQIRRTIFLDSRIFLNSEKKGISQHYFRMVIRIEFRNLFADKLL